MALVRFATAVGRGNQVTILTEPASAVSQPRPTPASHDSTANTTPKMTTEAAVAVANAGTAASFRRCRSRCIHTHTMNGRAMPAVAFTATAIAIRLTPHTG